MPVEQLPRHAKHFDELVYSETVLRLRFAFVLWGAVSAFSATKPSATHATAASPLLRGLSLHDRIAQLIVVRGYGDYPPASSAEYKRFLRWIETDHVGGFIVANHVANGNVQNAEPYEMVAFVNHVQKLARTPLLVASDFERGASMRVADTVKFPYLMAFGAAHDVDASKQLGIDTAHEARALGINWVFAPDADVNNNPDNPIINTRSFGADPRAVAENVAAFIEGAHSDPKQYVLVAPKHFPGHGDTAEDTHLQLGRLDQPKERLESLELVPFRAAIAHGADSIMTAHLAVPAFEPANIPATLSHNILTGLLRDELTFKGIVVTDALDMQGITSQFQEGEAAVRAIEAGADVLLMPIDPEPCIAAIESAIKSGRLTRARIDASVIRVLNAKQKVGLFKSRFVSVDALADELNDENAAHLAQDVAQRSLTLVKDDKHLVPFAAGSKNCLFVLRSDMFSHRGEVLVRELRRARADVVVYGAEADTPDPLLDATANAAASCQNIYIATFVTVTAYKGSVALDAPLSKLLHGVTQGKVPVAIVAFGSPFLLRDYSTASTLMATFSTTDTSEVAVAKALLGQAPVIGRLPVPIPGVAEIGTGLDVAKR